MPKTEQITQNPEAISTAPVAVNEANPILNETAEMVEGKVSEVAPSVRNKATGQPPTKTQKKDQSKRTDQKLTDRELLRARLLEQAPKEKLMKSEVRQVLEKEKIKLEGDIEKFRKKKQYHHLSAALMKLRAVMREIEKLARMSIEQLKETWLKVVHKFA